MSGARGMPPAHQAITVAPLQMDLRLYVDCEDCTERIHLRVEGSVALTAKFTGVACPGCGRTYSVEWRQEGDGDG